MSHANFALLFDAQLAKGKALRNTLEEFIRKQDFRFSDQITSEESKAWKSALDILVGSPGVFANEMGHDLFQRLRAKKTSLVEPLPNRSLFSLNGRLELLAGLKSPTHVALYMRKPLPDVLFQNIKELGQDRSRGTIEAIVEDLAVDTICEVYTRLISPYFTASACRNKRRFSLIAKRDSCWLKMKRNQHLPQTD